VKVILSDGEEVDGSPSLHILEYLRMFLVILGSISVGLY